MSGTVVSTYLSQDVLSGGTATSAIVMGTSAYQVAYSTATPVDRISAPALCTSPLTTPPLATMTLPPDSAVVSVAVAFTTYSAAPELTVALIVAPLETTNNSWPEPVALRPVLVAAETIMVMPEARWLDTWKDPNRQPPGSATAAGPHRSVQDVNG